MVREEMCQASRGCCWEPMFGYSAVEDTLWMVDQVSRMASGGLSASFMKLLMNFFGVVSRAASGPQDERNKVDVWVSIKLDLLGSLGHMTWAGAGCCDEGWVAGERRNNGNIKIRWWCHRD